MAILNVIKMGNPILREHAKELTPSEILSEETHQLLQDLYDTMKAEGGIGIAAPQVGISKSVALINIESGQSRYSEATEFPLLKIFNPKIKILDETLQGFWEGCLSVPGLRGYVERPRQVEISYLDENAEPQSIIAEDFLATVFQHELDHLFGKIYVDRIKDITLLSYDDELNQVLSK
ncbi:peptide deformylase [Bacteriovorax sp. Seq25_V]|uniref:peptide deformylase n=1 Tax=Bacteriovorax sp. Seq25_V TaxID=1201288 RepID=UPI00038A273F|nr:peptide deformylase [Bacteriovorax sp. Seq25_V]EQC45366.1 peptide deformylase [Bacteriovorax sp. Seq25_V]